MRWEVTGNPGLPGTDGFWSPSPKMIITVSTQPLVGSPFPVFGGTKTVLVRPSPLMSPVVKKGLVFSKLVSSGDKVTGPRAAGVAAPVDGIAPGWDQESAAQGPLEASKDCEGSAEPVTAPVDELTLASEPYSVTFASVDSPVSRLAW